MEDGGSQAHGDGGRKVGHVGHGGWRWRIQHNWEWSMGVDGGWSIEDGDNRA
jgi:hypothetical protein